MEENVKVTFDNNKAFQGGAVFINMLTNFIVKGNSIAFFYNNLATDGGGAVEVLNNSSITLHNNISIRFTNNGAQYGGAIFLDATAVMVNNNNKNYINFDENNFAGILGSSVYQDVTKLCNKSCLNNRMIGISDELILHQIN